MVHPLVVIVGPTAVGKSRLAVKLAQKLDGEIVSGDALQVYRGLDIGTAKISEDEKEGVTHHLIDLIGPKENFSVARYRESAIQAIEDIQQRGKLPLLVGGTGLYINSVIDDYAFPELPTDQELRRRLASLGEERGREHLFDCLLQVDPQSAEVIKPGDLRRVVRALEVYHLTGKPISSFHNLQEPRMSRYRLFMAGLNLERNRLYIRIDKRVESMLEQGLVEEVLRLLRHGYDPGDNAMQALGYKEIIGCLNHQYDLATAVDLIKRNTRRYAKRQLTWFRRDTRIKWYNVEFYTTYEILVEEIYQDICRTLTLCVE